MPISMFLAGNPPIVSMKDSDVIKAVQTILVKEGFDLGLHPVDGDFGSKSQNALRDFKAAHGLDRNSLMIGPLTAKALDDAASRPPRPAPEFPPWLRTAVANIGVLEVPGSGDNPRILAMARECGGNIARDYVHDAIPWCKMFVEYCLRHNGFKGTDDLWALNSRNIGISLNGPAVGAIASKSRSGGGHTFFVLGRDASGHIVGVGGNQSDSVDRAIFDPSILKYNWPAGFPEPVVGFSKLPVVATARFSKSEA